VKPTLPTNPESPPDSIVLNILEPGEEVELELGRIRLDVSGYLCDRLTAVWFFHMGRRTQNLTASNSNKSVPAAT